MDIRAVDQRDQTWEFPQPKYRVYFHDEAGAADEREVEGADVAEVMAWAEHSETVGPSRTASPRHQTLRAVVDWSYDLLEPPARRLFDRLGVFVGGFTLEAAEAVCVGEGEPPWPSRWPRWSTSHW